MSKMSDMAMTIEELRSAAAAINEAASWLAEQFGGAADEVPVKEPAAKEEKKTELKLEDVRAVLAEKSRAGHTAAIRTLLQKYGASKLFAAVGGWLGYFLGGCDGLLYALLAFVVIDYITGVMCAIADKNLSSEVGFKGICRKVLIFLLVGIANVLDVQVIGTGSVLRTAVIFFYISNEGVSLLENVAHLGLPVPEKIKTVLEQLHDRAESEVK